MQAILSVSESDVIVYCRGCGALAGKPSQCPVYSRYEYSFVGSRVPVVCRGCGAVPGVPSQCPVYSKYQHSFSPVPVTD
ncbi:MAG: hypothetical protein FLDDKLPJ_01617 [Phycisphaerae bacterium]|nr:hypothetical protein [Phycisphaerae bacterium]